jgi:cytochrome c5
MHRFLLLAITVAAGCAQPDECALEEPAPQTLAAQRAYETACARCHDQGLDGAPAVGDRAAWANRSSAWVAVLEEHAKDGYLAMPPRGGDPGLCDQDVSAAAEHMLMLTHPDRQPD